MTIYRPVNRTHYCSSNAQQTSQLGLATLRAGHFLSIMCVFFGIAAAFVPGSLEQRIGSLLFFGLMPAAGFHAAGIVLGRLLAFSSELCEMIAALCLRWLARAGKNFITLVSRSVSYASARYLIVPARSVFSKISSLSGTACRLIQSGCRRADRAIFEFSCLLIRSGARSILRMQACRKMRRR
jgi:hypothetical protein